MHTTYVGKAPYVTVRANEGSRCIEIDVSGKSALLSVQSAEKVVEKLEEAIRRSA